MHNALCALGRDASLEACEKVCKTDADGTSPKQLIAGAKAMGLEVVAEIREAKPDVALLRLDRALTRGLAAVLVVDDDEHWIAVVGMIGQRYLVADSADSELVLSLDAEALAERWEGAGRKPYYAIILGVP